MLARLARCMSRIGTALIRAVKRFIADTPINNYEALAFRTVREAAMTFGRVTT